MSAAALRVPLVPLAELTCPVWGCRRCYAHRSSLVNHMRLEHPGAQATKALGPKRKLKLKSRRGTKRRRQSGVPPVKPVGGAVPKPPASAAGEAPVQAPAPASVLLADESESESKSEPATLPPSRATPTTACASWPRALATHPIAATSSSDSGESGDSDSDSGCGFDKVCAPPTVAEQAETRKLRGACSAALPRAALPADSQFILSLARLGGLAPLGSLLAGSSESYAAHFSHLLLAECQAEIADGLSEGPPSCGWRLESFELDRGLMRCCLSSPGDPAVQLVVGDAVLLRNGLFESRALVVQVPGTRHVVIERDGRVTPPLALQVQRLAGLVTARREFSAIHSTASLHPAVRAALLSPQPYRLALEADGDLTSAPKQTVAALLAVLVWERSALLNHQQAEAVRQALLPGPPDMPSAGISLCLGPPGTGKSSVVVAIVSALLLALDKPRILLCAPSNVAVDEVARRLLQSGVLGADGARVPLRAGQLVRCGAESVVDAAVAPALLDALVAKERALSEQQGRPMRSQAHIRRTVLGAAEVFVTTCSGAAADASLDELRFDVCVMDEAAQCTEPCTLVPLTRGAARIVLVGDPKQLTAVVTQRGERERRALGCSLFERLWAAQHPARMLQVQYRMHPEISAFPSARFYSSWLINAPAVQLGSPFAGRPDFQLPGGARMPVSPYAFVDVVGGREGRTRTAGASFDNAAEVEVVVRLVRHLVGACGVEPASLGIISFYAAQRAALWERLRLSGVVIRCAAPAFFLSERIVPHALAIAASSARVTASRAARWTSSSSAARAPPTWASSATSAV